VPNPIELEECSYYNPSMFSDRTGFDLRPNELATLTSDLKRQGRSVFDLTLSNPTRAGLRYPDTEILSAISRSEAMTYAPDPLGLVRAREAIAQYYSDRGNDISQEDIVLTSSTSEAYTFLFKLLADPGDRILIPSPSYPLFQYLARFEGLESVAYPLIYADGWLCDLDEFASLADGSRARAVLCVHPNNPTGSYVKELPQLQSLARRNQVPLICDEVFFDYRLSAEPVPDPISSNESMTFVLNGLSKTVALPQLKLSWIVLSGPANLRKAARERLELISDTYLSVNTAVQHAVPELLELRHPIQDQIAARLRANLDSLRTDLGKSPVRLLEPEGGWYAVLRLPAWHDDEEFSLRMLKEKGVLLHPGSFFGFSGDCYVVVSLLPEEIGFRKGIQGIVELAS
jgi:aspartate/methionine/tyrosine aminotransferase